MKPDVKCSRCGFVVHGDDKNYDERKKRHVQGRHTRHITQNERYPDTDPKEMNGGLGGLDIGKVNWITIW